MKQYIFIATIFTSCLIYTADKKISLIDPSEIDYAEWTLHRTNKKGGIHVEEYHFAAGPLPILIKKNCFLRLFACMCCAKTLHDRHQKILREQQNSYDFLYDHTTSTIHRFYRYK